MAPKKAETAAKKAVPDHPTYKDMIKEAIISLKDRKGSSRQQIKKYLESHFKVKSNFDSQFNIALRRGVAAGDFSQPKGPSGPVKLVKKEGASKETVKKEAPKKEAPKKAPAVVAKKAAAKKVAPKKATSVATKDKKVTKPKKTAAAAKKTKTKAAAATKKAAPKKKAASKK